VSAALVAALACLLAVLGNAPVGQAATAEVIQNVGVQVGPDGSVTALTSTTAIRDDKGAVTGTTVDLNPQTDGQSLPVRVSTAWWLGDETGTNLADLQGKSGQITIEIGVENLTLKPETVSFEDNGAKYRQFALIGVPMTVTMSTRMSKDAFAQIVTMGADGSNSTNGVVSQASSDETVVQWAALMAPPMLPPTTVFRLVINATNFTPPEFDLMVQPGLVTDPSIGQLVAAAAGLDSGAQQQQETTLGVVTDVATELQQGQDLIDSVYQALTEDAAQLGGRTYSELQATSSAMLSQIDATSQALSQLSQQTSSQVTSFEGGLNLDLAALATQLNTQVLGSTTDPLTFTAGSVENCSITFPDLPPDAPKTLASTVRLIQAQLQTIIDAFADPTTDSGDGISSSTNCRTTLTEHLKAELGEPGADCSVDDSSLRCTLTDAKSALEAAEQNLRAEKTSLLTQLNGLGIDELGAQVGAMASDLGQLKTGLDQIKTDLSSISTSTLQSLQNAAEDIEAQTDTVRDVIGQMMSTTPGVISLSSVEQDLTSLSQKASTDSTTASNYQSEAQSTVGAISSSLGLLQSAVGPTGSLTRAINQLVANWGTLPPAVTNGLDPATLESDLNAASNAVSSIQTSVTSFNGSGAIAAMTGLPGDLTSLSNSLKAAAGALTQLRTTLQSEDILGLLNGIWDATSGTGLAAQLVAGLQAMIDMKTSGVLADATTRAETLSTLLDGAYSGLVTPGEACPDGALPPVSTNPYTSSSPSTSFDSVIWLSNYLTCGQAAMNQSIQDWYSQSRLSIDDVETGLGAAVLQNDAALASALNDVDTLTATLSTNLSTTSLALTQNNLAAIGDAETQTTTEVAMILSSFTNSANSIVTGMVSQVNAANLNAAASRQALQLDFETILANLGSPDPLSRTGLLGQLHTTTAKVSNTVDLLDNVQQQVSGTGTTVSNQIVALKLQAAQYQAAQDRLSNLPPFPGLPGGVDNALTVYSIHVSGR